MANVKIHVHGCDLAQSTTKIERGLDILSYLIHAKLYSDSKSDYLKRFNIQKGYLLEFMQKSHLSDLLELYICKTMLSVSGELQQPQREFFDAVSCIYTHALRQAILKQKKYDADKLKNMSSICSASTSLTFFNMHMAVEKIEQMQDQVDLISEDHEEEVYESTLSLALIVAKIASFVEKNSLLKSVSLAQFQVEMMKDPFRSIGELSKILIEFVNLNVPDEEQMIRAKLDQAILSTLKFFGLKEDKPEVVVQIREILFESHVVTLIEKEDELMLDGSEKCGPSSL